MQNYNVKLDSFEGPMDLLLFLIKKNEIDIYDIPIYEITEQYLSYISMFNELNMEIASDFVVTAADLLLIKSKMMLPKIQNSPTDFETENDDPRQVLVNRLLEYKYYKEISEQFGHMIINQRKFISRYPSPLIQKACKLKTITVADMITAFNLIELSQKEIAIPKAIVTREEFSVNKQITLILKMLSNANKKILFQDLIAHASIQEIVVTFFALLELIRNKNLKVVQSVPCSNIYIFFNDKMG